MDIVCLLLNLYTLVLLARVVMSWFEPRGGMATVDGYLRAATEPVLGPVRRALPRSGAIDLSPLAVFFGIILLSRIIC
jgi:YggT family protein